MHRPQSKSTNMPTLWKSSSSAGRPKTGHRSIRGTISGPIPIPVTLEDEEFPIRNPGSGVATTTNDDEFPIRHPGAGIASPVPPEKPDSSESEKQQQQQEQEQEQEHQHQQQEEREGGEVEVEVQEQQQQQQEEEVQYQEQEVEVDEYRQDEQLDDELEEQLDEQLDEQAALEPSPVFNRVATITEDPVDGLDDMELEPPPSESQPGIALESTPPPRVSASRISPQSAPTQRISPPRTLHQRHPSYQRVSSHQRMPTPIMSTPMVRRANIPSVVRESMTSDVPSLEAPQRKKSTLRSAIGRFFGRSRKKGGGSQDLSAHISRPLNSSQHQSVGGMSGMGSMGSMSGMGGLSGLSQPVPSTRSKEGGESKRSASLPITEYDRPLRSHSIGPNDILAIESARNSFQVDNSPAKQRAVTAHSRIFIQPRRDVEWGLGIGLTPRPASTHARGNRTMTRAESPSNIGRAITSDSGTSHRRRSRSLSGLEDINGRPGTRRRSDEIRYWRESYEHGLMSPLSSNPAEEVERDDAGQTSMLDTQVTVPPPKTPPQPFNFGRITPDMFGMKITQAASIETRIGSLESRAHKLERTVDQLCHSVPGFKSPLAEAIGRAVSSGTSGDVSEQQPGFAYTSEVPPAIPSMYQNFAATPARSPRAPPSPLRPSSSRHSLDTDSHSAISFGDAPTFIGSLHPPSSSATHAQSTTATAPPMPPTFDSLNRPISISTVRGATSMPTMGRDASSRESSSSSEHYTVLAAQLDAERVARQNLEAQVKKLSERLNALSTTMFAMVGGPAKSRSQERLAPPSTNVSPQMPSPPAFNKTLRALSVFETDDDGVNEEDGQISPKEQPVASSQGSGEDDEDFVTPHEEQHQQQQSYGAFGEELHDEIDGDDPARRKAARTLSLSQLTMGKGIRTQI